MTSIGNKQIMSENLQYYMRIYNLSQKELAEIAQVQESTFSEWINAKKYPRMDKIELMANYFGIPKSGLIEKRNQNDDVDPLTAEIARRSRALPDETKKAILAILRQMEDAEEGK